jgi:drug/metabolite transporter superfamily protein YnfA
VICAVVVVEVFTVIFTRLQAAGQTPGAATRIYVEQSVQWSKQMLPQNLTLDYFDCLSGLQAAGQTPGAATSSYVEQSVQWSKQI